jgi:hypothetical protein
MERSDVDEVMRSMQGAFDQAQLAEVRPLSVRVGVVEEFSGCGAIRFEKKKEIGCGEGD